jgi:hypothetical protein
MMGVMKAVPGLAVAVPTDRIDDATRDKLCILEGNSMPTSR